MRIVAPPPRRPPWGGWPTLALTAASLALAFGLGAAAGASGSYGGLVRALLEGRPEAVSRWLAARLAAPGERLRLELKPEDLRRLEAYREQALASGAPHPRGQGAVPAALRSTSGEPARVELRLKRDPAEPPGDDGWALDVEVLGLTNVLGTRRFYLQRPRTQHAAAGWLYQRALQREDLLAPRSEFVELALNEDPLGVYALEERPDERMLERSGRPAGPILGFDEEATGREVERPVHPTRGAARAPFGKAAAELEEFRRGERSVAEVFDSARLARYFALGDLFGVEHGTRWHDLRFYWNPVLLRFEPIGSACDCRPMERAAHDPERAVPEARPFHERVLADPAFHALYLAELERIRSAAFVRDLLAALEPELRRALAVLHREAPDAEPPEELLQRNQAYLRSRVEPVAALGASAGVPEERRDAHR